MLKSGVHPVHRICGDFSCRHLLSEQDEFLCRFLAMKSLKRCLPVTTFLTPGQETSGTLHQPRHDKRVIIECFLRPALDVALDCSNDSTLQHYRILDEPLSPFDFLSPFTASSVVTSALHIEATRFLYATIAGSVSLPNVISR